MSYMELLKSSVEYFSGGAITLSEVPEHLRISQASVVALGYDMAECIAVNERVRCDSYKRAGSKKYACW